MRHLDLVAGNLPRFADKIAVVAGAQRYSYAEVDQRVDRLGAALQERGVRPADRVALLAGNELEYLEIQAACVRYGFALVPLNVRLTPRELEFIVADCTPSVLIAGRGLGATATQVAAAAGVLELLGLGAADGLPAYDDALVAAGPPAAPPASPELIATILYTSGTTGRPKGAMIDRAGFTARVLINATELEITSADVHLAVLPMFHIAAFLAYAHTARGATVVLLPEFSAESALGALEREQVTTTCLVPTIIGMLTEHPDRTKHDLSQLRLMIYGGSSIESDPLRQAIEAFGCSFHQQYGMTETGGQTILRPADHDPGDETALSSAGTEAIAVLVRVVDEQDRPVADGATGEIVCRAPSLMVGYWNRPDATAEALRWGWFHTGDIGFRDDRGYLHVADRRNDLIVTGGENVYPREVEAVLAEHPAVGEVSVIGTPDSRWGQVVTAVVAGATLPDEGEIGGWLRERLASYKVPRRWFLLDELPRNATGKVLKHELRARFSEAGSDAGGDEFRPAAAV